MPYKSHQPAATMPPRDHNNEAATGKKRKPQRTSTMYWEWKQGALSMNKRAGAKPLKIPGEEKIRDTTRHQWGGNRSMEKGIQGKIRG